MKKISLIFAALSVMACSTEMTTPKDQLAKRLADMAASGQIAYAHQDDLAYGHTWCVEDWEADALERSDVKAVAGKYPAMVGFDLGDIEHGADKNLDGVPFGLIRKAALAHIGRGGMVTFSWHPDNIVTGGDAWDVSSNQVVASILPGGEKHAEFMVWLQRAADFFESLGDVAVIFRPWHENSGNWFWWCANVCTVDQYKALFRMTYDYFTNERGLTNLLWCFSPNGPFTEESYMERYPGDDIIDILGTDYYQFVGSEGLDASGVRYVAELSDMLARLTKMGREHGKLIALSETGLEGIPDTKWWCDVLYPALQDYPVTYVLTWRNAHDKPGHFYGPWEGYGGEEDFKAFAAKDKILLLD
jgi:mannan endo-1,4-beta-mannosidase